MAGAFFGISWDFIFIACSFFCYMSSLFLRNVLRMFSEEATVRILRRNTRAYKVKRATDMRRFDSTLLTVLRRFNYLLRSSITSRTI